MVISRNEPVVVVGAGCFGISTAYHLLQRGFTDVTVLDRSERLPAPDAASTDLNKSERAYLSSSHFPKKKVLTINPQSAWPSVNLYFLKVVRTSYSDIFYAQLALDAIQEWKKTDEWGDTYRE